jgi:hypothetical protein
MSWWPSRRASVSFSVFFDLNKGEDNGPHGLFQEKIVEML